MARIRLGKTGSGYFARAAEARRLSEEREKDRQARKDEGWASFGRNLLSGAVETGLNWAGEYMPHKADLREAELAESDARVARSDQLRQQGKYKTRELEREKIEAERERGIQEEMRRLQFGGGSATDAPSPTGSPDRVPPAPQAQPPEAMVPSAGWAQQPGAEAAMRPIQQIQDAADRMDMEGEAARALQNREDEEKKAAIEGREPPLPMEPWWETPATERPAASIPRGLGTSVQQETPALLRDARFRGPLRSEQGSQAQPTSPQAARTRAQGRPAQEEGESLNTRIARFRLEQEEAKRRQAIFDSAFTRAQEIAKSSVAARPSAGRGRRTYALEVRDASMEDVMAHGAAAFLYQRGTPPGTGRSGSVAGAWRDLIRGLTREQQQRLTVTIRGIQNATGKQDPVDVAVVQSHLVNRPQLLKDLAGVNGHDKANRARDTLVGLIGSTRRMERSEREQADIRGQDREAAERNLRDARGRLERLEREKREVIQRGSTTSLFGVPVEQDESKIDTRALDEQIREARAAIQRAEQRAAEARAAQASGAQASGAQRGSASSEERENSEPVPESEEEIEGVMREYPHLPRERTANFVRQLHRLREEGDTAGHQRVLDQMEAMNKMHETLTWPGGQ